MSSTYLDFAATTPVDRSVAEVVMTYMTEEFGNSGSRTHSFGASAAKAVDRAREQVVAGLAGVEPSGIIFTSGATEANNLAILGLREYAIAAGRRHVVATAIEHKAVLEPVEALRKEGFEVDLVKPGEDGVVDADEVVTRVRPDTAVVSVMHVNNETGAIQPVAQIADALNDDGVFLHTDDAQGFGKLIGDLDHPRIDMVSISGHKIFAPKGVGALAMRRRNRKHPPLKSLMHGGGQERGLRPGTVPVPIVVGLGAATAIALEARADRTRALLSFRSALLEALLSVGAQVNGDPTKSAPNILNVSIPSVDSEAAVLALKSHVAVSNGSACTSSSYEPSHVLAAMGLDDDRVRGAVRFSWSHDTDIDLVQGIPPLLQRLT